MYLDTPIIMALLRLFPHQGRWSPLLGLLIMCIALTMSSFATTTQHLIITQGIFYAIGGSIAYSPCIVYLEEWFVKRKGTAYGIMWSGTGIAGVVLPLFLEYLLTKYGFQTTLRVWACTVLALTVPLSFFIKPRLPPSANTHIKPLRHMSSWLLSRPFLLYQLASVVEATGFFLPAVFLPSYARAALGAGSVSAATTVLLVNVASVFGTISMGLLIDRLHVTTCILASSIGATVGTLVLWGCAGSSMPVLYFFCVVYGLFAGSFTATWPGVMQEITKMGAAAATSSSDQTDHTVLTTPGPRAVDPSMVYAFLALGRGIGNVISGPLSEVLVKGSPWQGESLGGFGSGYGPLIVFTGTTAFLGGGSFFWKQLGWL